MISRLRNIWRCVRNATYDTIVTHDGIEHAGYLAFLGLLAIFPFLVFTVALVGLIGQGDAGSAFISSLIANLPDDVIRALKPRIEEIISGPPQGLLTISILGAIWTASSLIEGMRTILNRAYRVGNPPAYWFRRLLSVFQLIIFTFIIVVAMSINLILPPLVHYLESLMHINIVKEEILGWKQIVFLFTVGMLFATVSYIYYVIPNIKQRFITVAPGALITILLWLYAAELFTAYLSNFDQVNLIYGSLGGVIAALLFFYICNIIFIFGAELNHQVAEQLGIRAIQREATLEAPPKE